MKLKDQTVMVTGAGGFIGCHLVESLLREGAEVKAMISYGSSGKIGGLDELDESLRDGMELFRGDIRDRGRVASAMKEASVVIHLAGLGTVPYSFEAPESYVSTNIGGTLNILEEARRLELAKVVTTSTAAVYGKPQYLPVDEMHPCRASSPYGASKIGAERLAESYYRGFGMPVATVRPFNTYGPRQSTRAVIPSMISQLLEMRDEILVGDLSPTRDMVFVGDTVTALKKVAESETACGHEINIATGLEAKVETIVKELVRAINPSARIVVDPSRVRLKEGEEDRIYGSCGKLRELTGWAPETSLEAGLAATIAWFEARKKGEV